MMNWRHHHIKKGEVMNWDGKNFVDVIAVGHSGSYGHENGQDQ